MRARGLKILLAVLLLSAWACAYSVDLTWDPVAWPTTIKYHVWRSRTSGGPYVRRHGGKLTYWTDLYVKPGVTYYYVVTAFDSVTLQESGYSNECMVLIPTP